MENKRAQFIQTAREVLAPFGRDYALGAIRSLAVRNMISIALPEPVEGFYPIVKVHLMALKDLEDVYYNYIQRNQTEDSMDLIMNLVEERVWE